MDYREEIKKLIDKTQNQEKLKIIYRIVKRYLGLEQNTSPFFLPILK